MERMNIELAILYYKYIIYQCDRHFVENKDKSALFRVLFFPREREYTYDCLEHLN